MMPYMHSMNHLISDVNNLVIYLLFELSVRLDRLHHDTELFVGGGGGSVRYNKDM